MASNRHEPKYNDNGTTCIVKCSCGSFQEEHPSKAKAMRAWAKHLRKVGG